MYKVGNCKVNERSRSPRMVVGNCTSGEKEMLFSYDMGNRIFFTASKNDGAVKENELAVMTKAVDGYLKAQGLKA